jgi:hypothetical protein
MPHKYIANRFRVWLNRCRLRRYGLRPATENDLDFIMEEVREGARLGHYAAPLLEPDQSIAFRVQLRNTIRNSTMIRWSDRGVEEIGARLWVYGRNRDNQVGYLLVSEKVAGSFTTDIELYKAGVKANRRAEGHGRRIVQLFVAFSPTNVKLYARCLSSSEVMFQLLKEVGFTHFNTTAGGTKELQLCK